MIIGIVQARMGSTRLPGKTLAEIAGRPMLGWVVERTKRAESLDAVLVATTVSPDDDRIAEFSELEGIACFRGSEKDVLDRYYKAATEYGGDTVVRVTGDCPLIDPEVIDRVVARFQEGECDYVSNVLRRTYPDGLDVEVFSYESLERAWREASKPTEREHTTLYFRTNPGFRTANVESDFDSAVRSLRWTVDELRDLEFIRHIYDRLGGHPTTGEVLQLLREEPQLKEIHRSIIPHEGYYVSIARESSAHGQVNRSLEESRALLERARAVIPSQTQTFSKGPTQFVQGVSPAFLSRGKGSHVWDVDGNEYIDYVSALGAVILGYDDPAVSEAVRAQVGKGSTFSLPHHLEVEVAEELVELIPCAEMVRFGKNGSDATAGAVRAARALTGRERIACCGYHGWQDWYIGTTSRSLGVPSSTRELTRTFSYNDLESVERLFHEEGDSIAAVIMEPVGVVEPVDGFLQDVKELAHRHGALLIFDEVITGFRIDMAGAQGHYGVIPDLACFGKAMANGFPLSAVVGRADLMEVFDRIFFSFTFGGEAVSLAAAQATLTELRRRDLIPFLWAQGEKLRDGFNVIARELGLDGRVRCIGLPPRTVVRFHENGTSTLLLRSLLQQELAKQGILFLTGHNVTACHSDADVDRTLRAYRNALGVIAEALEAGDPESRLEGPPVQPIFRDA